MASGSMHGLSTIVEVTRGTTPATPAMEAFRHTSCTLNQTCDFFQSTELRSDRQITDTIAGAYRVGGDVGFELSYGSFDTYLEALLGGTWNTNVLKAGTTRRDFTVERKFADIAEADGRYWRFRGCEFSKMTLSVKPNAKVDGTFTLVGKDLAIDTAIITGETYTAASTTTPFNSFTGTLTEGGTTIAIVTELSMSLDNGIAPIYVVGARPSVTPDIGRSNLTGSMSCQFVNDDLYAKFIAQTESAIVLTLTDPANNSLSFDIPRIKYTGSTIDVANEGTITQSLQWQALYASDAHASNIVITRTPHA